MQLTRILMFYKNRMKVPGNLYAGKHRLYAPITLKVKREALAQLMVEQENLELISRPYLSREEDIGHMKDMGRQGLLFEAIKEKSHSKMRPHYTIEEHLAHVNITRRWE